MKYILTILLTLFAITPAFAKAEKIEQIKQSGLYIGGGYSKKSYRISSQEFRKDEIWNSETYVFDEIIKPVSPVLNPITNLENGFLNLGYKTSNFRDTPFFIGINFLGHVNSKIEHYLYYGYTTPIRDENFKFSLTPMIEGSFILGLKFDILSIYGIAGTTLYEEEIKATFSPHQHNKKYSKKLKNAFFFGGGVELIIVENLAIFGEFTVEQYKYDTQNYYFMSLSWSEVKMKKNVNNIKVGSRFYF